MLGKLTLSALVVVAIGAAAAVAYGAIPSADGGINGCYSTITGAVRVVDEAEACRTNESPLSWNQQGIQGLQGEQGPQGPQGIQGPAGTTATSNVYFASFYAHISGGVQVEAVMLGFLDEPKTVLTLDLPAGAYVIEARLVADLLTTLDASTRVQCNLPGDASARLSLDSAERPLVAQNSSDDSIELTTAINHGGGPVQLTCKAFTNDDIPTAVTSATLLATPVGAINPPGA